MGNVIELDERGSIQLPDDVLDALKPGTRFTVERESATLILRPALDQAPTVVASPSERAIAVRGWAAMARPPAPVLGDEALRREHLYD